jgi:esterase
LRLGAAWLLPINYINIEMSNNHTPELLHYKAYTPESPLAQKQLPLIILHGLLGSMDNWRTQAKRLAANRPVITMDLRNHGNSPHIKGMSYREMYEDVLKVVKYLEIKRFDLLGHSMGGKVAMQLALNDNENDRETESATKNLLNRLIVVDIAPRPYPLWHQQTLQAIMNAPVEKMESRQEIDEYLKGSIEDPIERSFMIKNLRRANDSDEPDNTDSNKGFRWKCNLSEISKGYLKIAGFSTAHQISLHQTLFIRGENSSYIQEQDFPLIHALFPHSSIITIKNSGHLPHFQQADEFFSNVDTFLSPLE